MSEIKPGDRVTPENVASLPIGTVVRFYDGGDAFSATKVEPDRWEGDEDVYDDDSLSNPDESPALVVTIGRGSAIEQVTALLTHAAQTDGAHHKQHDICAALRVLLSAEDYAALGIDDEGVPS